MNLVSELKKFFHGDIDTSEATLNKYSRDASLFKVKPELVVAPKNVEDIKNLVIFVNQAVVDGQKVSLTARSAGTDMTGGPLTESIVVDFTKYFNRLKNVGADYAVVEPGVYYRDFEKETLQHNLLMPSYPASRELCTVGGMVANNAGGEKTLKYGKTENYTEEIKAVLADGQEYVFRKLSAMELQTKIAQKDFEGQVYKKMATLIKDNYELLQKAKPKVTKNSSGYFLWNVFNPVEKTFDLTKLLVGSQGTLGLITEIKFKLIKPKPASRLLVIFLKDLKPLADLTARILKYDPESFESYDDNTFRLAIKFFPEILHQIKGSIFKLVLSLIPEAWVILTDGIPKLVLLAEFTADTEAEATTRAQTAEAEIKKSHPGLKMHVTRNKEETEQFWLIRRESFNLLRHHVRGLRTAPFIDDFSVKAEYLPKFLPHLYAILNRYKLLYTVAGHIGDGNFHIIPLMDLSKPKAKHTIVKLSKEVYGLVLSYKGSITGEHNDGLIRSPFLQEEFGGKVYRLFEETKKIFDPNNVFNPGKKVNANLDYAMAHLDTSM